jgi:predicted AlkP superfamily pyrophosphatase or phosphodiesterase
MISSRHAFPKQKFEISLMSDPLILVNAVGLTSRLLALAPRIKAIADSGWCRTLIEPLPAVTCTSQATILTGKTPQEHGIVGNGWYFRDTGEVRFWQQSNALLEAEPLYVTAQKRAAEKGRTFRAAKLFWWYNQGAEVAISVTPKPYYGADGNKAFGISGTPFGLTDRLEKRLGPFPFRTFWGPGAGLGCTQWIAKCAASILESDRPDLSLVYLPHLDYEPQRFGPAACDMPRLVGELDDAMSPLLDTAKRLGARVWVVSEYGHCDVNQVIEPNRALRQKGFLTIRPGPFGEVFDPFVSRAFAVCDHQLVHVYVKNTEDIPAVAELIASLTGVASVHIGDGRSEIGLNHSRSGEVIALAKPNAWFAYPFWLEDRLAPDYARTVDIHRKPGYDPCELFFDPKLRWPKLRVIRRLLQKKLGLRTLFDVIPLDPSVVRGSHGLQAANDLDRPIVIGTGRSPEGTGAMPMTGVRDLILEALGLG